MGIENFFFLILVTLASLCNGEGSLSCDWSPNVTVAQDGTGDHITINEALNSVPDHNNFRFIIHIKAGVYIENVVVSKKKMNVVMFGDGNTTTIISGSLNRIDEPWLKTFQTATFSVKGSGFIGRDIRFVNTAGPEKHQAVAFHSQSNQSVMFRCVFEGYQDTLYAHAGQQLYRECEIIGTIDFILGSALAVFQNCAIQLHNPLLKQNNTITAHAGLGQQGKSGFSILNCSIMPYMGETFTGIAYLGRPWNATATVVVMKTLIGELIHPNGWIQWNDQPPPPTITYGEYQNYGPGSNVSHRITWKGYNPEMSNEEAQKYTIGVLISQNGWLNNTCVPFDMGI